MKQRNKTRELIIIMVILTVIVAGVLVLINKMSAGNNDNSEAQKVTGKREWTEISDNIKYMVQSADLEVKYVSSSKRNVIYLIGSDTYYGIQYNDGQQSLYLLEGTYTADAVTDEDKIYEAETEIDGKDGKRYAQGVVSFTVDGDDASGFFPDGTIDITFGVTVDNAVTRNSFKATIPTAGEAQ